MLQLHVDKQLCLNHSSCPYLCISMDGMIIALTTKTISFLHIILHLHVLPYWRLIPLNYFRIGLHNLCVDNRNTFCGYFPFRQHQRKPKTGGDQPVNCQCCDRYRYKHVRTHPHSNNTGLQVRVVRFSQADVNLEEVPGQRKQSITCMHEANM